MEPSPLQQLRSSSSSLLPRTEVHEEGREGNGVEQVESYLRILLISLRGFPALGSRFLQPIPPLSYQTRLKKTHPTLGHW